MFVLKVNDQDINLKWGTRAMKLFCEARGVELDGFFDILQGMAQDIELTAVNIEKSFNLLADMIKAGYQSANKKAADDDDVCDWIDACGGITKVNEGALVGYVNYVISMTYNGVSPLPGDKPVTEDAEKKNL